MDSVTSRLTVYFEDPFWVGVYERESDGLLEAAKITFGAEPKDAEVYRAMFCRRLLFSPGIEAGKAAKGTLNPKRRQRQARRAVLDTGSGTKAQQALKLLREQNKAARKVYSKAAQEAKEERKYALRQKKKKEKHRGH